MEEWKKAWKNGRRKNMTLYENHDIEFKQEYVSDINKEAIAFANAEGGTILVGIQKDGQVCGIDDPDDTMQRITNSLRDTVSPDIMPFISVKTIIMDEKKVVEITVTTGTNRPYYIKDKGLKPSGVYIRKGSSSQPMSDDGIREMIIQTSGRSFESCRSLKQELSFNSFKAEMNSRNIKLGNAQMKTLKLIGEDGLYTNLAYLLSDQCETSTKVAIFQGTDKSVFRERREFDGSLIKQMNEVYQLLDLNNKTKATFSGLNRTDTRDYPEEALREAWLNCLIHRDYSFSGSTIINIYDDKIEFVSLGGLVSGLSIDAIFLGVSQTRNPNLAAIFYRMGLIESYGTGVGKIMEGYYGFEPKPVFETAQGAFRVTLPNRNEKVTLVADKSDTKKSLSRSEEKEIILNYVKENKFITRRETENLINSGSSKSAAILSELCEDRKLRSLGNGKKIKYELRM